MWKKIPLFNHFYCTFSINNKSNPKRTYKGQQTVNRGFGSHRPNTKITCSVVGLFYSRSTQAHADIHTTSVSYIHTTKTLCWLRQQTRLYGLGGDKKWASYRCSKWAPTAAQSLFTRRLLVCSYFSLVYSKVVLSLSFSRHIWSTPPLAIRIIVVYAKRNKNVPALNSKSS